MYAKDVPWESTQNALSMIMIEKHMQHNWILGMIAPEEAFSGRNPYVSHFKIFGASVYCHVSKESRKKLDLTTKLGVFFGYIETPHNYRGYMPSLKMTAVRRYVKFDEDKAMWCSLERDLKIP